MELNTSVSECLRYMCDNHWNTPEGDLDSSTLLVQQHDVAPRQYKKIALMVASSKGAWKDLDRILLTKVIIVILRNYEKHANKSVSNYSD